MSNRPTAEEILTPLWLRLFLARIGSGRVAGFFSIMSTLRAMALDLDPVAPHMLSESVPIAASTVRVLLRLPLRGVPSEGAAASLYVRLV